MNTEELKSALDACVSGLTKRGFHPRRCNNKITNPSRTEQLEHLLWAVTEVKSFVDEGRIEKAMRWLGFIQGVLWSNHQYSIDDLKDMNRPMEKAVLDQGILDAVFKSDEKGIYVEVSQGKEDNEKQR